MLIALFLVGDEVRNLCVCVAFEYWGSSVHVFRGELGELSSVFVGLGLKACQEIQSSLLERSCVLLPRVTWIEFSACFKG